jgi:hypothetical protein
METNHVLAYAGYLAWLVAGAADFVCHARADLARTSGLRESGLHVIEMTLCAGLLLAWLIFDPGLGVFLVQFALVLAHAVAGYLDTRAAWRRRVITPVEQHLHSVLDLAPWIALGIVAYANAPAALQAGWPVAVRETPLPPRLWALVLVPAMLLCGLPLAREFWRAAAARRSPGAA